LISWQNSRAIAWALIPFSGSAFALCPLTLDYDAFRESLNALDTELIPRQGTDLASAVKEAERLFDETGNNHRVLVLLTDGEDLEGAVDEAVKAAAKKQMAIHTVGVGSPEGASIPIRYQNGRSDFLRDASGQVVKTTLDEKTLKKIASETNALYVPLGRGAEGLNTIYQEKLRLVPQSEQSQRMQRIPLERFEWPLGAAVFLLLAEFFIRDRLRTKRPLRVPATAALGITVMSLFPGESRAAELVSADTDPRRIYNQGTEAYSKGDFEKAADSLRSSLKTPDLTLQQKSYYNLGNSLYRTGQGTLEKDPEATIKTWEESIKAYQDALSLNDTDEDAKYNKAFVEKKLEELKKQQNKEDQQDKKDDKDQKEGDESKDQKDSKDGEKPNEEKDSKEGEKPKEGDKSEEGKDPKDASKPGEEKKADESKESKGEKGDEEKKDAKDAAQSKEGEEKPGEKQEQAMSNERAQKVEMTAEEAQQLLETLRSDERTVIPIPQPQRTRQLTPDNSTKGKTW
jgi:Ca-activated chloride channel homolog